MEDKLKTIEFIKNQLELFVGEPSTFEEIKIAENVLSVSFSKEYKNYLSQFGFAVFKGHELTGLCNGKRLDVVKITQLEKSCLKEINKSWYVIEQTNVDGIVIWQDSAGFVYQVDRNGKIQNKFLSIYDFLIKTN